MENIMTDEQFNVELQRLMALIKEGNLSKEDEEKIKKLAEETKQRHKDIKNSVKDLKDSLSNLRLMIKYLLFDIEACRRENKYLRDLLNNDGDSQESSI
jgi:hypothetical protein